MVAVFGDHPCWEPGQPSTLKDEPGPLPGPARGAFFALAPPKRYRGGEFAVKIGSCAALFGATITTRVFPDPRLGVVCARPRLLGLSGKL